MAQKKKKGIKIVRLLIIIVIAAFLCYSAFQLVQQQKILIRQREKIEQLLQQKDLLDEERARLQKELEDCNSNAFIERCLRKLGMLKDGEILFETTPKPAN